MTVEQLLEAREIIRQMADCAADEGRNEDAERLLFIAVRLGNVALRTLGSRQCGPPELHDA